MQDRFRGAAWCLCALFVCGASNAGPLTPPAGPVGETHKTLSEMEPRRILNEVPGDGISTHRITESGSYFLTGDVLGEAGKQGILVAAARVTIDLNGFTVDGQGVGLVGIGAGLVDQTVRVSNGAVRNWTSHGISLSNAVFTDITAADNGGAGIESANSVFERCGAFNSGGSAGLSFIRCTARNCLVKDSAGSGFYCEASALSGCSSVSSGADGYLVFGTSAVGCFAQGSGEHGFNLGFASSAQSCRSQFNTLDGFHAAAAATLTGCAANLNTVNGFHFEVLSTAIDCVADANGNIGFDAGVDGALLRGCSATANTAAGFENSVGTTIDCQANANAVGFDISSGVIRGCTAARNTSHGFDIGSETRVESNVANYNTGVGFNGAASIQSYIVRNSATGNAGGDFVIPAGNAAGPVLDLTGGGGTVTGTDSMSNVRH